LSGNITVAARISNQTIQCLSTGKKDKDNKNSHYQLEWAEVGGAKISDNIGVASPWITDFVIINQCLHVPGSVTKSNF